MGTMTPITSQIDQQAASPAPAFQGSVIMVEDDHELREMLAEYLTRVGFEVVAVDTGLKFYHALAEQRFQVAVIDLGLPDMNGLQLADYIHQNTTMRCIILTARDAVDDRVAGYDAGADLYMVKPVDCRELAAAISRKIKRATADQPVRESNQEDCWRLNRLHATLVSPSNAIIPLTTKEIAFLQILAAAGGQTIPRDTILATMGYVLDEFSQNALESLIRRLRRKIEQTAGHAPIQTRHGIGYLFSAPVILS